MTVLAAWGDGRLVGLKIITSPSVPEGVILVVSPGLTPAQGAGTVAPMPDDPTPANSTVPSAPFFENWVPDFIVPPLEKPLLHPTPEVVAANPTDEELFRTNDIRIPLTRLSEEAASKTRRAFDAFLPPAASAERGHPGYAQGGIVSKPYGWPSDHDVHVLAVSNPRPTATILMVRTRRLGRQRWTWHLREDHTATKMCFGRFYTNYDEAVTAALASTGGYAVSPVIRGAKPKGRA